MGFKVVFFQSHDGFSLIDLLFHLEALGSDYIFSLTFKTKQNIAIVIYCPNRKFQEHTVLFRKKKKKSSGEGIACSPCRTHMPTLGTAEDVWYLFSSLLTARVFVKANWY